MSRSEGIWAGSAHREDFEWVGVHAFVIVGVLVVTLTTVSVLTLVGRALSVSVLLEVVLIGWECCGPYCLFTWSTRSSQFMMDESVRGLGEESFR